MNEQLTGNWRGSSHLRRMGSILAIFVVAAGITAACSPSIVRSLPITTQPSVQSTKTLQIGTTVTPTRVTETLKPTTQPTTCPLSQDKVGDNWVWYPSTCNKGMSVAIAATSARINDLKVEDTNATPGDFKLIRLVINFEVKDSQNKIIEKFNPPLNMYLAYTNQDISAVKTADKLSFAFVNENNAWVKFTKAKHGYTLLRAKSNSSPVTFEFLDTGLVWKAVGLEGTTYTFNGNKIPKAEVDFIYQKIKSYPDFSGFAFAQVSSWADRLIGAGS